MFSVEFNRKEIIKKLKLNTSFAHIIYEFIFHETLNWHLRNSQRIEHFLQFDVDSLKF